MAEAIRDTWFKFYLNDWWDATRHLTLEQRGAYIDFIVLQMRRRSDVPEDYTWLGHQLHVSTRRARTLMESLIASMKITRTADGLSNERAASELLKRTDRCSSAVKLPRKVRETIQIPHTTHNEINELPKTEPTKIPIYEKKSNTLLRGRDQTIGIPKTLTLSEPSSDEPKKRTKNPYTEDFEAFWRAYPDRTNNSKINAAVQWRKLTADEQAAVMRSLPRLAAYCKAVPDYRCIHAERFLRSRRFETLNEEAEREAERQVGHWWEDAAKVRDMPLDRWRQGITQFANGRWPVDKLGPPPGHERCVVPPSLVAELRLTEVYDRSGLKRGYGRG